MYDISNYTGIPGALQALASRNHICLFRFTEPLLINHGTVLTRKMRKAPWFAMLKRLGGVDAGVVVSDYFGQVMRQPIDHIERGDQTTSTSPGVFEVIEATYTQ